MTQIRRGLTATLLLLTPGLVACGGDAEHTHEYKVVEESPTDDPAGDGAAGDGATEDGSPEGEAAPADLPTIAASELTPTQQALYEDLLVYAPDAAAEHEGEITLSSGTFGGEFETSEPVPEGIQVATGYLIISGTEGVEVTLNTEDGEKMTWVNGDARVAMPADSADDEALLADAEALATAMREWVEKNGEAPQLRGGAGVYVLEPGLFDEGAEGEVEVPMSEEVDFLSGPSVADQYSVTLTSLTTLQGAVIDQDGTSYLQTYIVESD